MNTYFIFNVIMSVLSCLHVKDIILMGVISFYWVKTLGLWIYLKQQTHSSSESVQLWSEVAFLHDVGVALTTPTLSFKINPISTAETVRVCPNHSLKASTVCAAITIVTLCSS